MRLQPFTPAWLAGESRALDLLPRGFVDPTARAAAVRRAATRSVSPAVLESITATTSAQEAGRTKLAAGGAACVVTGQQVGLFGGPLYTVYKAAAAIVDARALEVETGVPCVPVFWLQNEDHDFDEIAACHVLGPDHALHRVSADDDPAFAGVSVARRPMRAARALQELRASIPESAARSLLERCYAAEAPAHVGFRTWLEALFAEHGLLVIDPCEPGLQDAARTVHEQALARRSAIGAALQERSEALEAAGFAVQVHVRAEAPLSFVHPEGLDGPRYRVESEADGWRLCGTSRVIPEAVLTRGPFSTTALLRPILQDTWLPTAAYVGGPGEIAYFAQLPPLYEALGVPLPLVVPRARFRVIDAAWARVLDQLGWGVSDLERGRDALANELAARDGGIDVGALERALTEPVRRALAEGAPGIVAVDATLEGAVDRTQRTVERAVQRLVERVRRAQALREGVSAARLDRVLTALQPGGAPQERVHGWPWFGARYGVQGFVQAVLDAVRPFHGGLVDLPLEPSP